MISQGSQPIGKSHTITKCDQFSLESIDHKKVVDVFEEDLKLMLLKKYDIDSDSIKIDENSIPDEYQNLFKGEIQVAFPVRTSDQNDYLVRDIISVDEEAGSMQISQELHLNDPIIFVHRDDETVRSDLSHRLIKLRKRVTHEQGGDFQPKAGIYISCIARAGCDFGKGDIGGEMSLIRDILGDIPLTGFYASGEIHAGKLYGYTGVLILFL